MKLTFLGACEMVTGSSYLLETEKRKILIDCGMQQGSRFAETENYEPFTFDPKEIDYVLITHAHIDHCGRIPRLVRQGFHGEIISTYATLDFVQLMLLDSAHVIHGDAANMNKEPLYSEGDVTAMAKLFHGVQYNRPLTLTEDIVVTFFDAGHILGSSFIRVSHAGKNVVFSGDLGNPPVPLLKVTESLVPTDDLVMESTYGNKVHEPAFERKLLLSSAIYETITMGGVLLIPAFALERTQEILYELNDLVEHKEIPPVPIFIDSPLAIKATALYRNYNALFNGHTKYVIDSGDDIFKFKGLTFTPTREESKKINRVKAPKIILAGSGMMQGGRVRFHLQRYLSDYRNQVLIVGYQVEGSLGRQLLEKAKVVSIDGEQIEVNAKIRAIGAYSAHADQPKLLNWIGSSATLPKRIWLTHGEVEQARGLARAIQQRYNVPVQIPKHGQIITV